MSRRPRQDARGDGEAVIGDITNYPCHCSLFFCSGEKILQEKSLLRERFNSWLNKLATSPYTLSGIIPFYINKKGG